LTIPINDTQCTIMLNVIILSVVFDSLLS
jgi:hypothetical protein